MALIRQSRDGERPRGDFNRLPPEQHGLRLIFSLIGEDVFVVRVVSGDNHNTDLQTGLLLFLDYAAREGGLRILMLWAGSKTYTIGYLAQARIPHEIEVLQDGLHCCRRICFSLDREGGEISVRHDLKYPDASAIWGRLTRRGRATGRVSIRRR